MAFPINRGYHQGRNTLVIPPTTDMALVFPFDHENKRYDKGFYSAFLTDGRASYEQIELFLKEAETVFQKKLKWLKRFKAYLIFAFVSGFFLLTLFSMTVLSDIDDDSTYYYADTETQVHNVHANHGKNFRHHNKSHQYDLDDQLDTMFISWVFLMFSAMVWGLIFNCVKRSALKGARKGVQEVVDRYSSHFASLGLRWNIPLAFPHYIELWKDYKGQSYTQPNNHVCYTTNPLNFQQIHSQLQLQGQNQRYPTLSGNQVMDQRAVYTDIQNNGPSSPLLNNQGQRREANEYIPPYPTHFISGNNQ